ncbi:MAG: hypothetical protein ACR2JQ_04195 [Mycobacteriales bacterium]
MTAPIEVTPDAVAAYGLRVAGEVASVRSAQQEVAGISSLSGTTPAGPALAQFRVTWSRALRILQSDVDGVARAVSQAAVRWREQDRTITRAAIGTGRVAD